MSKDFEVFRGRLIFAENQVFGRMACKHMHCISRACRAKGLVRIHDDLAASLLYVRDRVVLGDARTVSAATRQTFSSLYRCLPGKRKEWLRRHPLQLPGAYG